MKPKLKKNSTESAMFIAWRGDHDAEQLETFSRNCSLATPLTKKGQKQYAASLVLVGDRWVLQLHVNDNGKEMHWRRFQTMDLGNEETLCELDGGARHA